MKTARTALLCLLAFSACNAPALDVYLIRHAETMGNVTGNYSEENQNTFSPRGLEQVAAITAKLKPYTFDHILVSPRWRTRQTILPYLQAHGLTAEIWPEIDECDCGIRGDLSPAAAIPAGDPIVIAGSETNFFRLRDAESENFFAPTNMSEGLAQLLKGCDLIRSRFGGKDTSVLLVTHSCTGARIMEGLLGTRIMGRFGPGNAAITHIRQEENGAFRLLMYNDAPFEQRYEWQFANNAVPVPGKRLSIQLKPKFFAQQSSEAYRLDWQIRDANRRAVEAGSRIFMPKPDQDESLLGLSFPTLGAAFGDTWEMETTLYADRGEIQRWKTSLFFPTYYSLAGPWLVQAGDKENWASPDGTNRTWLTTMVPGGWEADALTNYDGIAWYRKEFSIPAEYIALWSNAPLGLALGAVDDADETYLNGTLIGKSGSFPPEKITAWDQPRVYPFDAALLAPTNAISVLVSDWGGGGGIWKWPVAIGPLDALNEAIGAKP